MTSTRAVGFLILLITIVHCDASLVLIPRGPCGSGVTNWSCPSTDIAFYPLATALSHEEDDNSRTPTAGHYLGCYYPFLSDCQYSTKSGSIILDNDEGYCPDVALRQDCTTGTCSYTCPDRDHANYILGIGSQAFGQVLFCTYPTQSQLNSSQYFCRYSTMDGHLYWGTDPTTTAAPAFCPSEAICPSEAPSLSSSVAPTSTSISSSDQRLNIAYSAVVLGVVVGISMMHHT